MSFEQILSFIHSQNEMIIYSILLASAFIENIFPPFPGDTTTLAGAFVAGEGNVGYLGVLISVTLGGVLGGMALYYIGKIKGRLYFEHSEGRYFGRRNLGRVETLFGKYGNVILVFSRFFAGIRSAIAIGAGLGNVKTARMLLLTTVSNLLWCGMLVGLMYYTKSNWKSIIDFVKRYHLILFAVAVVIFIIWIARIKWMRKKR